MVEHNTMRHAKTIGIDIGEVFIKDIEFFSQIF